MASMAEVKTDLSDLRAARDLAERQWRECRDEIDTEARTAANKARAEVVARHSGHLLTLQDAKAVAEAAWQAELDATATHEWEGKKVTRQASVSRWSTKDKAVFGVVEVRRSGTEFPENTASYGLPAMGEAFVRLLNKSGVPGKRFERMRSYSGWKLAE